MNATLKEIKDITADAVAKKQDAAKINFPVILDIIKAKAKEGESYCTISVNQMNEWDKALLVTEGFRVSLIDKPQASRDLLAQYNPGNQKVWKIDW